MIENLSTDCLREFAHFMLGEGRLGSGMSRVVFDHPHDPAKIIKVENSQHFFQNVMEWETWRAWEHCPDVARWLAPCHAISHNGTFLIMDKAFDCRPHEIPETLPAFLTDHKPENFGVIGTGRKRRVVARDYGYVRHNLQTSHRKWIK